MFLKLFTQKLSNVMEYKDICSHLVIKNLLTNTEHPSYFKVEILVKRDKSDQFKKDT